MEGKGETLNSSDVSPRFPAALIVATVAIMMGLMVWLRWTDYSASVEHRAELARTAKLSYACAQILHLDEVLTMSAQMSAVTGDKAWIARYNQYDPELVRIIKEAEELAQVKKSLTDTANANQRLVQMEKKSLDLVLAGRRNEAWALLTGPAYRRDKAIYAGSINAFLRDIENEERNHTSRDAYSSQIQFLGRVASNFLVLALWLLVLWRVVSAWRQKVERQKAVSDSIHKLSQLQADLLDPGPLEQKLKKITDGVVDIFDADFCRVWLIGPGDECSSGCVHATAAEWSHVCQNRERCLHLVSSSGRYTHIDSPMHRRVPLGCYKIGRIATGDNRGFLTNDVANDSRIHNREWAKELGLVSFAGFQLRSPHGDGIGVLALFSKRPISPDAYAQMENVGHVIVRVTQTARAEESLRGSEERYRVLFQGTSDAIMTLAPPLWNFTAGNSATMGMFGAKTEAEFTSLSPLNLSPMRQPDGQRSEEKAKEMIETALREGSHFFEWTHKRLDGEEFFATVLLSRLEVAGRFFLLATVRDITASKQAEEALRQANEEVERERANLLTIFNSAQVMMLLIDEDLSIRRVNDTAAQLMGKGLSEIINHQPGDGLSCANANAAKGGCGTSKKCSDCSLRKILTSAAKDGQAIKGAEVKCCLLTHDREKEFWFSVNAAQIDVDGKRHAIVSLVDITERKHSEEDLDHKARHDALTGLPNRMEFRESLERLISSHGRRRRHKLALMYLDLDGFKQVNDSLGHEAGDQLLAQVGARLSRCLRGSDVLARMGGDEFTILLPHVKEAEEIDVVAQRILKRLSSPFIIGSHKLSIGASIGIATYPDNAGDAETLVRNADIALYAAKEAGRGRYVRSSSEITPELIKKAEKTRELRLAKQTDEAAPRRQRSDIAA